MNKLLLKSQLLKNHQTSNQLLMLKRSYKTSLKNNLLKQAKAGDANKQVSSSSDVNDAQANVKHAEEVALRLRLKTSKLIKRPKS